ncbi:MAG: hypothetical protein JSW60_09030 [Thermoplasmatales archaeon]|nr:MAG: hypothetical protein JSW60_09030 [Thermoplasmatales archaeon]
MTKYLRAVKVSLIMGILLISALTAFTNGIFRESTVSAQRTKIFSFNSYIDIEYDVTPLSLPLAIDFSVNVPLKIRYRTDVPKTFLWFLPWQLRNIILFGSMIGPMQKIHIEVTDKPDWADIYISQPDLFVDIPFKDSYYEKNTSLVISPREEAPAVPQSITLKMESETIGRINKIIFTVIVPFTPSFVPTVTITPERPTRTVSPRESVEFKIPVKNNANKKIRVEPQLPHVGDKWAPTLNPPFHDIMPGEQEEFIFSIYTPFDFGWHNEIQSFKINFTAQMFPIRTGSPVGGPYSIYLRVNNYGFSTPGFELLALLAAIVIAGIIIKKKYKK